MTQSPTEAAFPALPASPVEMQRLIDRGRHLQAEALQKAFRDIFGFLVSGCSLRGLRLPAPQGQRQSCC